MGGAPVLHQRCGRGPPRGFRASTGRRCSDKDAPQALRHAHINRASFFPVQEPKYTLRFQLEIGSAFGSVFHFHIEEMQTLDGRVSHSINKNGITVRPVRFGDTRAS